MLRIAGSESIVALAGAVDGAGRVFIGVGEEELGEIGNVLEQLGGWRGCGGGASSWFKSIPGNSDNSTKS